MCVCVIVYNHYVRAHLPHLQQIIELEKTAKIKVVWKFTANDMAVVHVMSCYGTCSSPNEESSPAP